MKRFSLLCALAVVMALLVAGAAAAETVTVYTTLEEMHAKELFDAYEKETGIKVDWVRLTSGEAVARLEAEKATPRVSIWVGGVGTLHIDAKNKGLTAPYNSRAASSIPEKFRDPEQYWIGLYVGPIAFGMNIDRAKELGLSMPLSWADIVKPEFEKLARVANPGTSGTAYNMITTLIRIADDDEDKAFEFLRELDRSIDQYTKSGSAPGKSCAIGEIPVAIGYLHDLIKLQVQGAPLEIAVPNDGTGFETAAMSMVKDGPDPVNGKKLYDWVLGQSAMDIVASWFVIPLSSKASPVDTGFSFEKMVLVNQDDVWDAANKERLLDRWNREIGDLR
ncbi:MAG: ABC transporter substrate-binding protein [Synergistaceae bacterium]|nr:ABC transporter substrate-binding protein [Synergistota bacterium]NLM70343.1 ABC transporter substrate-binding protein [Synergistaceae bacterium]